MAENLTPEESLSTPGSGRRFVLPKRLRIDSEAFGRFAEWIARYMGSPAFLIWMTLFIAFWIIWNFVAPEEIRFDDPSSFILLTFMLSIEAAYSAPLILLAQNRQEARDRLSFDEDRRIAAQSRADTDFLAREIASLRAQMGEVATRDFIRSEIRDQLRDLLAELDKAEGQQEDPEPPQ
ncbi:hypothetical protein HMPREF1531_01817 [Propionibacterium sp. oral taxon 192 str. F0372]|uniref:DUF1003 domain-containing protein n=1 Tax=Propionibacterium sp. oral taxon 192 TaxID=671222 RepID=UPI0003538B4D|nr:DUF1003 domain-containing protein [Propionibacterium sp. oral taxon 192]EPH02509.1 hypothetical protein HMPREF1531_01817 [Propionibacterium sp. oral taxon 192 str. F0372]